MKSEVKAVKKAELSEEDEQLKALIGHLSEKIVSAAESSPEKLRAIAQLFREVRQTGNTGTTLPKQLKFLQPDYSRLVSFYELTDDQQVKRALADLLSVVAPTLEEAYDRHSLAYLRAGTGQLDVGDLGSEYILNLAGDLAAEYEAHLDGDRAALEAVHEVTRAILPKLFRNGNELSAVDLLLETERLDLLGDFLDAGNYPRIFNYLAASADYATDSQDLHDLLLCLFSAALKFADFANALRVALRMNDYRRMEEVLRQCTDKGVLKQLAFALGRHRVFALEGLSEEVRAIVSNQQLSGFYQELMKDLDVVEPKLPADVYKTLIDPSEQKIESSQLNLADSLVNGLVNLGGLRERLVGVAEGERPWIARVNEAGIMTTVGALGLVHMWNFESASAAFSEYFDLKDGYAKAGACIGLGIATSGVWDENDPAMAVLLEALESSDNAVKLGATIGLGLAYSGSSRTDFQSTLEALVTNETLPIETAACAALSQALVCVADCNEDVSNAILTSLMVFQQATLDKKFARFLAVALGVNFLGRLGQSEAVIEALSSVEHSIGAYAQLVVEVCSFAGTGDVLKVQKYMQLAAKEPANDNEVELQSVALLGVALLSISEPTGRGVFMRLIHQVLSYASPTLKRVVPVMLAVMGVVNGNIQITDMLFKLAHEEDQELAYRAILGLGLASAGTNNSRVATLLRSLGTYYANENAYQYVIRLALGLLHSGKGLVGVNPFYSDGFLCSKTGLAGLVITAFAMLNFEEFLIKHNHYMLLYLSLAMYPKMLFYVNEDLKEVKTAVRVGQAVDTVGQVGKPRNITGFQTHTSPVIVNLGERAELAGEECVPVADVVQENFVVVRK